MQSVMAEQSILPAAVILAAGASSRMGSSKAWLSFSEDQSFVEHLARVYVSFGCEPVIIVRPAVPDIRWAFTEFIPGHIVLVDNPDQQKGRMHSIQLGLDACRHSSYVFIQNVDSPFVDESILGRLFYHKDEGKTVVPEFEHRGGHPVLLGKEVADAVRGATKAKTLRDITRDMPFEKVAMDDARVLLNINTPTDYSDIYNQPATQV